MHRHVLQIAAVINIAVAAGAAAAPQQAAPRSVKEGVYTAEQATRGKAVYVDHCAECHGTMTTATPDMAPLLNDYVFQTTWKDRSVGDLFEKIRDTMPPNKRGILSTDQLADLIGYILSANALPAGDTPLPNDIEMLKQVRLDAGLP
jgi:mono/diheme cytochrome c family protein